MNFNQITKKLSIRIPFTVLIILGVGMIIAFLGISWSVLRYLSHFVDQEVVISHVIERQPKIETTVIQEYPLDSEQSDEIMLFIREGSVWRADGFCRKAIELIDRVNIAGAEYSPQREYLAYSEFVTTTEALSPEETGKRLTVQERYGAKQRLLIADPLGGNSRLVAESVAEWGWIPNHELVWFEKAELQEYFGLGYFGNGEVLTYDPRTGKSSQLFQEKGDFLVNSVLSPIWSPNGRYFAFYGLSEGGGSVLRSVERSTKKVIDLINIPRIGGDHGGPPPRPKTVWQPDSSSLIVAFTPILEASGQEQSYHPLLASGESAILRIPPNGTPISEVVPRAPSVFISEYTDVGVLFNESTTKLLVPQYAMLDKSKYRPEEWISGDLYRPPNHEVIPGLTLYVYNLESQEKRDIGDEFLRTYEYGYYFTPHTCGVMLDESATFLVSKKIGKKIFFDGVRLPFEPKGLEKLFTVPSPDTDSSQMYPTGCRVDRSGRFFFQLGNEMFFYYEGRLTRILTDIETVKFYSN